MLALCTEVFPHRFVKRVECGVGTTSDRVVLMRFGGFAVSLDLSVSHRGFVAPTCREAPSFNGNDHLNPALPPAHPAAIKVASASAVG